MAVALRRWPGTTLPDVGQLTAQASRIASDIAVVTERVQGAVDSQVIADLRGSVRDPVSYTHLTLPTNYSV